MILCRLYTFYILTLFYLCVFYNTYFQFIIPRNELFIALL